MHHAAAAAGEASTAVPAVAVDVLVAVLVAVLVGALAALAGSKPGCTRLLLQEGPAARPRSPPARPELAGARTAAHSRSRVGLGGFGGGVGGGGAPVEVGIGTVGLGPGSRLGS